jgi:GTP cyclohydrolase II
MGDISTPEPVLVRPKSVRQDIFGSMRCDCGERWLCKRLPKKTRCAYLYAARREGIGFHNKIRAYALQTRGWTPWKLISLWDLRPTCGPDVGAQISRPGHPALHR